MQLSDTLVVAMLSSPLILAIAQRLLNRKPNEQLKKIDAIAASFDNYKVEQAVQALAQKNWRVIEKKSASHYDIQEWYMLYDSLCRLLPEDKWKESLKDETKRARTYIEGE